MIARVMVNIYGINICFARTQGKLAE